MSHQLYKCARGASLRILYAVTSGDPAQVIPIQIAMRRKVNNEFIGNSVTLQTAARAALPRIPAGFDVIIPSILTANIPLGDYQLDGMLSIGGIVEETQACRVRIHQAASSPP